MRTNTFIYCCFLVHTLLVLPAPVQASLAVPPQAHTDSSILLPRGTPVSLELLEPANSNTLQVGNVVELSVYVPVTVGELTLIKANVYAEGEVVRVRKAGIFGRPGSITLQAVSVKALDGQSIPLESIEVTQTGKDRRALAWAGSLILPAVGVFIAATNPVAAAFTLPALGFGLLIKGKDVEIPAKTKVRAFVRRDVLIRI
ncbi:MAG: hypothetical protein R3D58_16230 [Saprospiraceae bacterium]|jgi:hypothetical protein|nr:hypothetical protein [Lewinellaceae bacterium]